MLALFTSILVEEFSFRTGILIGLGTYVVGALLYIPACVALCILLLAIWLYFLRHRIYTEVEATAQKGPLGRRILHVLGGLDPKCFKLGGPGMIMAILGGAVITPWMADVISAKESVFFSLVPMMDFTWDANLRTSSGAIRASFFIPIICFAVMFAYATIFGESRQRPPAA